MKWGRMILVAALFAVLPVASAQSAPPILPPSMPSTSVQIYSLHGTFGRYVSATRTASGSITIHVTTAPALAAFALGSTLTFRVTPTTIVRGDLGVKNTTGWVRVFGVSGLSSIGTLQTLTVMSVTADQLDTQPISTI